ncbi:MAG: 50S ribosomal protein L32e [Candidatus Syntropharchaeales archaeon]|nr:50S ribosomal protein L32e [Candidatus Syntrophoarchaeum sp.]
MSEKDRLLRVRRRERRDFKRHESHKKKKLDAKWRRPRGLHNKMRKHIRDKGRYVKSGFGSPRWVRGLHASGLKEVLVTSHKINLEAFDPADCAIRIASGIGKRKRLLIEDRANKLGLKVLNPLKIEKQE